MPSVPDNHDAERIRERLPHLCRRSGGTAKRSRSAAWAGNFKPPAGKDIPLTNLFLTMLQDTGIQTDAFAASTATLDW